MDYTKVQDSELDPKVLFLAGAPCCGKGTQSDKIKNKYGFKYFSVGDLLRDEKKKGGELGNKLKEIMASGALVPEDIIMDVMIKGMAGKGDVGFILPRNFSLMAFLET